MRALIFDIKRDCSEDGPGIRTTVFFQGCPLRCRWCQNPEGQDAGLNPDEHEAGRWYELTGMALMPPPKVKLAMPVSLTQTLSRSERDQMNRCASFTLDELLYRVLIDRPFFVATGGGVTLSGGEPTCQMRFAGAFLQRLQQAGIDTAIETCGFFHYASFEKLVLPYLNRIYFDLKIMDEDVHKQLTSQSNRPVLVNLARLKHDTEIPVTVRVALVPGMTATDENLTAIGRFLREQDIHEVTLLPYNPLWQDKAVRLGRQPLTCGFMSAAQLADCARQLNLISESCL